MKWLRRLKCFFGFHQIIEVITIRRGDFFFLNYFHCKHCGHDALKERYAKIYGKEHNLIKSA
jgi:hypothetical protein